MTMRVVYCLLLIMTCLAMGCSRGPRAIERVDVDLDATAQRAIAQLDSNSDGKIDEKEVRAAPGLAEAFARADKDDNQSLSAQEIGDYMNVIVDGSPAIFALEFELSYRGRPLDQATVTLVPESFQGDQFKPASGVSDADGFADVTMAAEDLPFEGSPFGVRPGLYRIQITSNKQNIPTKYNSNTELGIELSLSAPTLRSSRIRLDLK